MIKEISINQIRRIYSNSFCVGRIYSNSFCLLEETDKANKVYTMTLKDPTSNNALGEQMIEEMRQHLRSLEEVNVNNNIRSLIIRSDNPKYFSSGGHLKERNNMSLDEIILFTRRVRETINDLRMSEYGTISILSGDVIGGGAELALATDWRVCSNRTNTRICLPQVNMFSLPGYGGISRLQALVGDSWAKYIILTGCKLTPQFAYSLGIINFVGGDDEVSHWVDDLCMHLGSIASPNAISTLNKVMLDHSLQATQYEAALRANQVKRDALLKEWVDSKNKTGGI